MNALPSSAQWGQFRVHGWNLSLENRIGSGAISLVPIVRCSAMLSAADNSGSKTIYLIRHAESEENRRLESLKNAFFSLQKFAFPSRDDVCSSLELLNVPAQVDSAVSDAGKAQIEAVARQLQHDNFLKQIELVAHSPLCRARETSLGMLGCMAPDVKIENIRVEETVLLLEKTPAEWISSSSFLERIADLEEWLRQQPENNICLVGHSQFFKKMLGLDFKFGNCEVWQAQFHEKQWQNLKKLYGVEVNQESGKESSLDK